MTQTAESMEYRTEVKQLLDILAHSLYTDRDIFLRELISNASDALNRIQFEMLTNQEVADPNQELSIRITVDEEAKRISIADTGIGMNRDEMVENLGTIAHSGARAFINSAQERGGQSSIQEIIGQFGVGFYSAFMVASEITVTSRSYRPWDEAWAWQSSGDSSFTLAPADKQHRGTTIDIQLKPDAAEYASTWKLESIIRKHSDYVSFPIYVEKVETPEEGEDGDSDAEQGAETPVNRRTALWRQQPSQVKDEEYVDFYKQLTFDFNDPLLHIHLVTDAPANIRSILYIPSKRDRSMLQPQNRNGIRLYSRKVLIQENSEDLLPEYYRFVAGVIDSEDLPLNVSRETVQSNPMMRQIRRALVGRLNRELKSLAQNDPDNYAIFWQEFGTFIKEGVATEMSNQEPLLDLLRFYSTKSLAEAEAAKSAEPEPAEADSAHAPDTAPGEGEPGSEQPEDAQAQEDAEQPRAAGQPNGLMSLRTYVDRMDVDQEAIYFVLGEDLNSVKRSPHLDYFRANNIEVLYFIDPIDGYMASMLREYEGKPLRNVDDAGLDLPEKEPDDDSTEESVSEDEFAELIARFKSVLGDRVTDVKGSRQLVNSPCRLVSPEGSVDRDLQRILRLTQEEYELPKKLLELNRRHPVITNLAQIVHSGADNSLVDATIEQLFGNALLLEGIHPNPAEMVEHIQKLMETAVAERAR